MEATNQEPFSLQTTVLATYVRAARIEDLGQLSELLASSFYRKNGRSRWIYTLLRLGINEDLRQRLRTVRPFYACLAAVQIPAAANDVQLENAGSLAGTIEITRRSPYLWQSTAQSHIYLSNLAVRSDLRRQGIAQKLLATCESVALDWGFHDIYLHVMEDNRQARRLYRKAGYQVKEREETLFTWLGISSRRILLHKSLKKSSSVE